MRALPTHWHPTVTLHKLVFAVCCRQRSQAVERLWETAHGRTLEQVRVNLAERSYDIEIGAGNLAEAGRFLTDRAKVTHVVLLTDDHVQKPHAMRVAESLGEQDIEVDVISVEPGEESKSLDVAASLWQGLLDLGADRKTRRGGRRRRSGRRSGGLHRRHLRPGPPLSPSAHVAVGPGG